MIGSTMEALVRWTMIGLELAAIAGGFVWSVAKSIIVYTRDTTGGALRGVPAR